MPKLLIEEASIDKCLAHLGFGPDDIASSKNAQPPERFYIGGSSRVFDADIHRLTEFCEALRTLSEGFPSNELDVEWVYDTILRQSSPVNPVTMSLIKAAHDTGAVEPAKWRKATQWRQSLTQLQEAYGQLYVPKCSVKTPVSTGGSRCCAILVSLGDISLETEKYRKAAYGTLVMPTLEFKSMYIGLTVYPGTLLPDTNNICLGTSKPNYPKCLLGSRGPAAVRKWKANKHYDEYIHPHASIKYSGNIVTHGIYGLCVGDLNRGSQFQRALMSGKLVKAINLASSVLPNWRFEPRHPHPFSWTDVHKTCSNGHSYLLSRETAVCMGCGFSNCPRCVAENLVAPLDIRVGMFCQKGCSPKGVYFCPSCKASHKCKTCKKASVCPDHRSFCDYCGRYKCDKCRATRACPHID